MLKLTTAFVAALLVSTLTGAQPLPPAPVERCWLPMFGGAGMTDPQIALDMACVSGSLCYIPGGSNGAGFGIFKYRPAPGAQPIEMNNANTTFMDMSIVAGGTTSAPTGAVSGVSEFGVGTALEYLSQGTEWKAANFPNELIMLSESLSASRDGRKVAAIVASPFASATGQLATSIDGGRSYTFSNLAWKRPAGDNCSVPSQIFVVSGETIYLTWGNEPPQSSGSSSSGSSGNGQQRSGKTAGVDAKYLDANEIIAARKANGQVLVIKHTVTGAVRLHTKTVSELFSDRQEAQNQATTCNYYNGYILKSTDAGKTWQTQYTSQTDTLDQISCFDENSCAVIAFSATSSSVIVTTDGGATWKMAKTTPPGTQTSIESFGAVGFKSKTELWIAGSLETQTGGSGMFWKSIDAGATWQKYPHDISGVMVFMALTFAGEGSNGARDGLALGITAMKTGQVVRYAKQKDPGFFQQKVCVDAQCSFLCQTNSFEQETCLPTQGGSAMAVCNVPNNTITQYIYQTTSCIGSYQTSVMPLNQCLNTSSGSYFENLCN